MVTSFVYRLHPVGTVFAGPLAYGIEQCLSNTPAVTERINAGLELVRRRFNTNEWVGEYERIYRGAAEAQNWKYTNG